MPHNPRWLLLHTAKWDNSSTCSWGSNSSSKRALPHHLRGGLVLQCPGTQLLQRQQDGEQQQHRESNLQLQLQQ